MPAPLNVEAGRADRAYWRDLWRFRDLAWFLAWRDILVRYKQTVFGVAWAVLQPVLTMVVFTVVFGRLAKLPAPGGTEYAVLVFVALLPWQFFANALSNASGSLVGNAHLISKVYFPRLLVPLAALGPCAVDLAVGLVVLAGLMAWFHVVPDWRVLMLPLFLLLAAAAALGAGLWLAALSVRYRDFRYVVPFALQAGLFLSPVGFGSEVIPENWRLLYSLNPLVGVIDGFRWALLGGRTALYLPGLALSVVLVALLLAGGLRYFRRTERTFADVV